jgi:ligand-binding SRPBCC domain-containing protein
MKIYILTRSQTVPVPRSRVFPFFRDAENLGRITPAWLGFQILTPLPVSMQRGTIIDYAIHLLGLPLRWTTLISRYDPPSVFVDEQLRGPYAFWHHTHEFRSVRGGTEIIDTVRYAMPFGPVGRLAHGLVVRRQLEAIFSYRARRIAERFPPPADGKGRGR